MWSVGRRRPSDTNEAVRRRCSGNGASVQLKLSGPMPMFVGMTHRTTLLLPKGVGTLAQMLFMGAMPMFIRAPVRTAIPLPKQIGSPANNPIETLPCLGRDVQVIAKRFQWPTSADMHPGGQVLQVRIGHQLRMSCCPQGFFFVGCILWCNGTAQSPQVKSETCAELPFYFQLHRPGAPSSNHPLASRRS